MPSIVRSLATVLTRGKGVERTGANQRPKEAKLNGNHPNPFNPSTVLRFDVSEAGAVSLKVFDLPGQEVATIVNEPHDYTWTDTNATIARWYYRLKQVDLSVPVHFTEPIIVDVTTGVSEQQTVHEFRLEQNYPNPFNPTTEIRFAVGGSGLVSLKVFDVLGREVKTLVDETKTAGEYGVEWNAEGVASGVYLYRLAAGGHMTTRKMLLTR